MGTLFVFSHAGSAFPKTRRRLYALKLYPRYLAHVTKKIIKLINLAAAADEAPPQKWMSATSIARNTKIEEDVLKRYNKFYRFSRLPYNDGNFNFFAETHFRSGESKDKDESRGREWVEQYAEFVEDA